MKKDRDHLTDSSRSELRAKRRKTNVILNSLIVIVLLLIVIVSVNIFGKDDKTVANNSPEQTVAGTVEKSEQEEQKEKDQSKESANRDDEEEQTVDQNEDLNEDNEANEADEAGALDEEQVIEGGSNPNVKKTIKNPAWEPVESSQVEPAQDYKKNGVDWNEQIQAISNATGFDQSKDTLIKLENNGPRKSAATILIKETNTKYRVYIEWAEGQGWKPVLVEEMAN
ncbi:YrrS family protein [Niallia sp. Krafla_26]|uniref:YrrS family protein n=1 Tax=Niallia sp. Krafla_26 TaxID=3064703 RepID=UPI003D16E7BC